MLTPLERVEIYHKICVDCILFAFRLNQLLRFVDIRSSDRPRITHEFELDVAQEKLIAGDIQVE